VNVSTDKAASPTSVLGWTKRITERLTAHASEQGPTECVSVRFGNVLGSNGSVLRAFEAQAEHGLPITVTHPDITRYFMTITEASRLVIYAGAIGDPGEVLILDMGEPVKILDVARAVRRPARSAVWRSCSRAASEREAARGSDLARRARRAPGAQADHARGGAGAGALRRDVGRSGSRPGRYAGDRPERASGVGGCMMVGRASIETSGV
jgi:nucleoside-diphosphate-sugar epimerase